MYSSLLSTCDFPMRAKFSTKSKYFFIDSEKILKFVFRSFVNYEKKSCILKEQEIALLDALNKIYSFYSKLETKNTGKKIKINAKGHSARMSIYFVNRKIKTIYRAYVPTSKLLFELRFFFARAELNIHTGAKTKEHN